MGGGGGRNDQVWRIRMGVQRGKAIKGVGSSGKKVRKRLMRDKRERERERNRQAETEVTRSKLMHGQLSESRRQRKADHF